MCVQEVKVTVLDVCLTRYGDAIAVGVGYQEPPLQFINANAAGPSRQRSKNTAFCMWVFIPKITVY